MLLTKHLEMSMGEVLFPTSVIGSLPRPQFVKDLIADDCPVAEDEYRRLMGAAIRAAVAMQETAGLDVVTDGEWWRKSYIGVIAELAHGFELSRNPADGRPWTVVVDRLSPKQPGFIAHEIKFLKQLTNRRLKATLPAPALLGERMWDPARSGACSSIRPSAANTMTPSAPPTSPSTWSTRWSTASRGSSWPCTCAAG